MASTRATKSADHASQPRRMVGHEACKPVEKKEASRQPYAMNSPRLGPYAPETVMCICGVVGVTLAYAGRGSTLLFWNDEVITVEVAQKDFVELIVNRYDVAHSPLYFLIVKAWIFLAGALKNSVT